MVEAKERLAQLPEHVPRDAAPATGTYEQLNIWPADQHTGGPAMAVLGHESTDGRSWVLADKNEEGC
jgi:hypothetical protein